MPKNLMSKLFVVEKCYYVNLSYLLACCPKCTVLCQSKHALIHATRYMVSLPSNRTAVSLCFRELEQRRKEKVSLMDPFTKDSI